MDHTCIYCGKVHGQWWDWVNCCIDKKTDGMIRMNANKLIKETQKIAKYAERIDSMVYDLRTENEKIYSSEVKLIMFKKKVLDLVNSFKVWMDKIHDAKEAKLIEQIEANNEAIGKATKLSDNIKNLYK